MIKRQLAEPIQGDYPQAFVEQYPELAGVVHTASPDFSLTPSRLR